MRPQGGWKSIRRLVQPQRLHGELGLVPPADFDTTYWASQSGEPYRKNPVLTEVGTN